MLGCATQDARAQGWDAIVGAGLRTTPWGAGLNANAGYNLLWWGEHNPGDIFYGYIRPYVRTQVSGVVNRFEGGIEAFPLSFWGFQFGGATTFRNSDLATLSCSAVECKGRLDRNLFSTRLLLGYQEWVFVPFFRIEGLKPQLKTRNFGDENTNLRGRAGGDTLIGSSWTLGYRIKPELMTGLFFDTARMLHDGSNNFFGLAFTRMNFGPNTWTVGAGWYRSTFKGASFTGSLIYERNFASSLALN